MSLAALEGLRKTTDTCSLLTAKLIKSSPQKILAQGSDWRFLNELKRELKG